MKIVLAGLGQHEPFAPACYKALTQLGHQVFFYDFQKHLHSGFLGRIESRLLWGPGLLDLNQKLIKEIRRQQPDVVLIHNGNLISKQTIETLKSMTWVAGYQHDDPFGAFSNRIQFRNYRKTIPHYDSHHVIRELNIEDYKALGVQNVALLRTYYVPWLHYPLDGIQKSFDVVFIGHAEKDKRIGYVEHIVNKGVPLQIFGPARYWRRYFSKPVIDKVPPIRPLHGEEYVRTIAQSKICLAFYSQANRDDCAYRVFEIPACRGFLLAQDTPLMRSLYQAGAEVELFDSPESLFQKIRYYLDHDEHRERICQKGHERVRASEYDVVSKMKQWVRETQQFMKQGGE